MAVTDRPVTGVKRNPWDLSKAPGGSSGGSAAAVAGGLVPLTLGTDTNGSIRVPAALCGVFGLKPTFGRVSRAGMVPLAWSFDHVGPFARDVAVLKDASPIQHLSTLMPPMLLVVGERDFPMLEGDARSFVDKAMKACVYASFYLAKGRDHMGVVRALLDEKDPIVERMEAFVKNPRSLGK